MNIQDLIFSQLVAKTMLAALLIAHDQQTLEKVRDLLKEQAYTRELLPDMTLDETVLARNAAKEALLQVEVHLRIRDEPPPPKG